jgi:hypothetical protein
MPEFVLDHGTRAAGAAFKALDAFTQGYIEAAFFTSTGTPDDAGLQDADLSDLAPEAWQCMVSDCANFQLVWRAVLDEACEVDGYDLTRAGRDFWYTRNGHGAGFWDGDLPDALGEALTLACKGWRELSMYRGDDGKIYLA